MSTLVLDASFAVTACRSADGFAELDGHDLIAPPLIVALAEILDCRLVTIDGNLRRCANRLGRVITPEEL